MKKAQVKIIKGLSKEEKVSRIFFALLILSILIISTICLMNALNWINKPFPGFIMNQRLVVLNTGLDWTGTRAGLKFPDKLLKANGITITSRKDLDKIVQSVNVGETIKYIFEKDGQVIELSIPTMRFAFFDFIVNFVLFFGIGIIYLLIGTVVFIMKPDTKMSWAFIVFCFILSVTHIITFDIMSTHVMFRIYFFVTIFLPATIVHLSLVFPEQRRFIQRFPILLLIPYILSLILFILLNAYYQKPLFPKIHRFLYIYIILGAFLILFSTFQSFFKSKSLIARQRAKVVLFGIALAFPLPAIAIFLSNLGVLTGRLQIINDLTSVPLIVFPAFIGYAIAKHNLFDVDVYIKRAVGYGIMIVLVVMSEVSLDLLSKKVLSRMLGEYAEKAFPIIFALLIVLLFNPVYHKVREFVDKCFFRKKFDYKETVLSVSNALTSVLNLDEIIKRIINTVRKEMFIDTAGVVLVDPQRKCCRTVFVGDKPGNIENNIKDVCIPCDDPLLTLIAREKKLITKYDIEEDPHYINLKESCRQRFSEMDASMVMPLVYQDEVKGALALGYKKSGHFYTREDIDLLETLANHGAIAIENARLAEQMEKELMVRTDLARYLSPQVVDQIIKRDMRVDLEGHKKVVTVLISDIRNFIKITETYSPEQLVRILNEYFTEMSKIIFENQGSLDKYIGDAIVAVFGSLIPLENHAQSAARAAVQMMKCMPTLNEGWVRQYGLTMDIGIGINTGEVFLGNVGSPERMEFTVIGDTVNVASRLSDLAQAGQILITRNTFACLGSDILCRDLPTVVVKGKKEKQEVFEILYL